METPQHSGRQPLTPPMTPLGRVWRLGLCAALSASLFFGVSEQEWDTRRVLFWLELGLGAAAYVIVLGRRRSPLPVAIVLSLMSLASGIAAGPATLAMASVATHRRVRQVIAVGLLNTACSLTYVLLATAQMRESSLWPVVVALIGVNVAALGWGLFNGSRRALAHTLRQRAARHEADQLFRVHQARIAERTQIAREMHDVLAHRISQVSMHAGALAFREDLDADRLRAGLTEIQGQANTALEELRGVLGVLREDSTGELVDRPQPTLDEIAHLIGYVRDQGMEVTFASQVHPVESVPAAVGRTVYRIVQEGLTNAAKHARGRPVTVRLSGTPETGVTVLIRNRFAANAPTSPPTRAPGSGLGLIGLRERAELSGGRLVDRRSSTEFQLEGWIPWEK